MSETATSLPLPCGPVEDVDGWVVHITDLHAGTWIARNPGTGQSVDSSYRPVLLPQFVETARSLICKGRIECVAPMLSALRSEKNGVQWRAPNRSRLLPLTPVIRFDQGGGETQDPARWRLCVFGDMFLDYDSPVFACRWDDTETLAEMVRLIQHPEEVAVLFALDDRFAELRAAHRFEILPPTTLPAPHDFDQKIQKATRDLRMDVNVNNGQPQFSFAPIPRDDNETVAYVVTFGSAIIANDRNWSMLTAALASAFPGASISVHDGEPEFLLISTLPLADHELIAERERCGLTLYRGETLVAVTGARDQSRTRSR